jgi:hypothetical protein
VRRRDPFVETDIIKPRYLFGSSVWRLCLAVRLILSESMGDCTHGSVTAAAGRMDDSSLGLKPFRP